MRRLLQLGTLCLFLATFLTPLSECFDHWDLPGISNDVEFAVFVFVLGLALVLIVSRLLSALALLVHLAAQRHQRQPEPAHSATSRGLGAFFIPPLSPPPLRI